MAFRAALATILFMATANAQECSEFTDLWDIQSMPVDHQNPPMLQPGATFWVEYSVDCFRVPADIWLPGSAEAEKWADRETFTTEDLAVFEGGWQISRLPLGVPFGNIGRLLADDGTPLKITAGHVALGNGRVRSIVSVPDVVGVLAEVPGGEGTSPVEVGERLFLNWTLGLEPGSNLASDLSAALTSSSFFKAEIPVTVPEPSGYASLVVLFLGLIRHRLARRQRILHT